MYLTAVLILLLAYYVYSKKDKKYMKNVPGPRPNVFFGNTIDFVLRPTYEFLGVLQKYLDDYGSTVLVYDGPLSRAVITIDIKFVEHILSSTKLINKGGPYTYLYSWLGSGLLTSGGKKWKTRRRMLTPSFHFAILDNFIETFDSVSDIFIQKLEKEVGKSSVDVYPMVTLMTLDVICEATMGIKINAQSDKKSKYVNKVKTMCRILTDRMFSPLHAIFYPLTINYYREKSALKLLHAHTDKIIEDRIKEWNDKSKRNFESGRKKKLAFLDLMIQNMESEHLSRLDIREEVDTFMFEGHDTTSSAVTFTLYSLAQYPEVQEKVLLELREIFQYSKNTKLTVSDLQKMKYLELVIKETLRLYPSVPFIGRHLLEDLEWEGNLYPKGLNIMISIFALHRDPKYFKDPLKFIPERFVDSTMINPYVHIPFSAGPRNCIGQKFAMLELKSLISKVVRNFKLLPAEPANAVRLAPETILISKNGVHISLERRTE